MFWVLVVVIKLVYLPFRIVASLIHGQSFGLNVVPCFTEADAPDTDNTLNFLSVLSFIHSSRILFWDHGLKLGYSLIRALFFSNDKVFNLGGNNISGVLGQISGALELATQIQNGEMPDPY